MTNDPIGQAISDYYEKAATEDILIHTNYTEDEHLSPAYFFRSQEEMPHLEQTAINRCRGKVLDVGAAAGSHALLLQKRGLEVTALERSFLSAEIMKKRGVNKVICSDLFQFHESGFDTILVLMNGTGIGGTIEGLTRMLLHLKSLLNKNGRILIDSSDISYLFEEEDGSIWIELSNNNYFGEMDYEVHYKKWSEKFKWLFVDIGTLKKVAKAAGLQCEVIEKGIHYDYLAQLTCL